jgi:hypothetical protein
MILAALTILASSRAVNLRRRQSDETSDRTTYSERVSNGQEEVGNADLLPSDSKRPSKSLNPLLDLSSLEDTSAFDVDQSEPGGPYPKSLNDFYKGHPSVDPWRQSAIDTLPEQVYGSLKIAVILRPISSDEAGT